MFPLEGGIRRRDWLWMLVLLLAIMGIAGHFVLRGLVLNHETQIYERLRTLAQLQANQISSWLGDRLIDGRLFGQSVPFNDVVRQWQQKGNSDARAAVLQQMDTLLRIKGYETVLLVHANGDILLAVGEHQLSAPELEAAHARALTSGQVQVTELYPLHDAEGWHLHFDIVAPLIPVPGFDDLTLVLRLTEQDFLFPKLQEWTLDTHTGETLLVRLYGDEVVVLNTPRFSSEMPHELRVALTGDEELLTAVAKGDVAFGAALRGFDLWGQEALAIAAPIPGTDWWLLVKWGAAEVAMQVRGPVIWVLSVFLLVFLLATGGVFAWNQRQNLSLARVHQRNQENELELQRALALERGRVALEKSRRAQELQDLVDQRTQQLNEARLRAEAANHAKSAFLANMSHEIRTPLNAIVGLVHLLRQEQATPPQQDKLEKIEVSARHLLSIISDILDISKIEAGKFVLEQRDFHLSTVFDHVCSLISAAVQDKGLTLSVDLDAVPQWVRGDSARLRQALLNLAGNAVKFTEQGGIALRARLISADTEQLRIRFEVEDTGIGIAAEHLHHLFQAFAQADSGINRRFGGSGLGLLVTRRLAELMGGSVGAASVPNQGSCFWFEAVLAPGRGMQHKSASEPDHRESDLDLLPFAGLRVLLAEDHPINREVASELLHGAGFAVDCAANGREAVALAAAHDYALILMDVQMPDIDGLAATRQIRALPGRQEIPILALSANVFQEDRQAALAAGMNDFIAKPVDTQQMYRTLRRWLPLRIAQNSENPEAPALLPNNAHTSPGRYTRADGAEPTAQPSPAPQRFSADIHARLIEQLVAYHRTDPETLSALAAAGEWEKVNARAHSLKGAAAMVESRHLAATAASIESLAKTDRQVLECQRLCQQLATELERLAQNSVPSQNSIH